MLNLQQAVVFLNGEVLVIPIQNSLQLFFFFIFFRRNLAAAGIMTLLCCYHKCWKGAHPAGHPLEGFCCGRCVFKAFSQNDFEQVGRANEWYQSGKRHRKHCCNEKGTHERAERPVLTCAKLDDILAYINHGPTSQPASSSTAAASSLPWEEAS